MSQSHHPLKHVRTSVTTLYVQRDIVWSYFGQFENLNKWWNLLQFSDETALPVSGREYEAAVSRPANNGGSFLVNVLVEEFDPKNKITFRLPMPDVRYVFILEDRPPGCRVRASYYSNSNSLFARASHWLHWDPSLSWSPLSKLRRLVRG